MKDNSRKLHNSIIYDLRIKLLYWKPAHIATDGKCQQLIIKQLNLLKFIMTPIKTWSDGSLSGSAIMLLQVDR